MQKLASENGASLLCFDLGRRAATRMPATAFEHRVNVTRGYATLVITLWSIAIVLEEPACLAFWLKHAYVLNAAPTGWFGLGCSALFLAYLVIDTVIGILCRHRFRRSMGAVFLHHAFVGIAVAAFMLPSPPRGFFLYVWGEALTACRLLPPATRWPARSFVFAFRRALWIYVFARDAFFFEATRRRFGLGCALLPPFCAALLLALDLMWWQEHAKSGPRRPKDEEEGCSPCLGATSSSLPRSHGGEADDEDTAAREASGRPAAPVATNGGGEATTAAHGGHRIHEWRLGSGGLSPLLSPAAYMLKKPPSVSLDADADDEPEGMDTP